MRKAITIAVGLGCVGVAVMALAQARGQSASRGPNPDSQYRLGPDSLPQEGVPKGEIRGPYTLPSQVYPGTQHTYWVYVPAQYDPAVPAALMVYQDGQAFKDEKGDMRAQNVMDNLIYRREIPVMIGVFINPGRRPDQPEPTPRNWGDRDTNRPTEYNSLDDKYARVITEELMPALRKDFNISKDPEMHGIGGSSSGAIAAFTVAWERPNDFRKVLSNVGSFVNLRGGHVYPEKVLASEKKPIRVYLCDGRNDNRGLRNGRYDETRDWFYQNVRLMKALTQKGYDVNYSWGMNNHGQKFGGAILPDMMRWLWRDGPVSTDPKDAVERAFRQPAAKKNQGSDTMTPLDRSRRSFLKTSVALAGTTPFIAGSLQARSDEAGGPLIAYVGTFSSPLRDVLPTQVDLPPGNGRGIHLFRVDRATGAMTPAGIHEMGTSPSCLAVNAAGTRLYSANETDRVGDRQGGHGQRLRHRSGGRASDAAQHRPLRRCRPDLCEHPSVGTVPAGGQLFRRLRGGAADPARRSSGRRHGHQEGCRQDRPHQGDQRSTGQLCHQRTRSDSRAHDPGRSLGALRAACGPGPGSDLRLEVRRAEGRADSE